MNSTPTPDQLARLPKWAQDYVAWLRSRVAHLEAECHSASHEVVALVEKVEGLYEIKRHLEDKISDIKSELR